MPHMENTQPLTQVNADTRTPRAPRSPLKTILRVVLLIIGVWLLIAGLLAVAVFVSGEIRTPQQADTIIVLGAGLRRDGRAGDALTRRSLWAAQAYADGYAPRIICTGGITESRPRSESSACRELLIENGVPPEAIFIEERSRSTIENALFADEIMQANGWQSALVVTDSFHMLRASWIFNSQGIPHSGYPVPRNWMRISVYSVSLLREIAALHWQALIEVFDLPFTDFSITTTN